MLKRSTDICPLEVKSLTSPRLHSETKAEESGHRQGTPTKPNQTKLFINH